MPSSSFTSKHSFLTTRTAIILSGAVAIALLSWIFLQVYPAGVSIFFGLTTYIGIPLLLGLIGWRLWKGRETKMAAALKLVGIIFFLLPFSAGVSLFAAFYLPTPPESTLLGFLDLPQEERGIKNVSCRRTDTPPSAGKITCTFTVYTKVGTPHEYDGSIDLRYKPGPNEWTRYENPWR